MGAGVSGVPGLSVVKTAALLETEHAITQLPNMGAETAQEITQVDIILKMDNLNLIMYNPKQRHALAVVKSVWVNFYIKCSVFYLFLF